MKYKLAIMTTLLLVSQPSWAEINTHNDNNKSDVTDLNMVDLLKVQVTSVSKKAQSLSDAPAAVFVISHDDIKRSGVTSVPEALRMAPGIDVARIDANRWAITSRGFNGTLANKLLVLIDGRSVYTPSFSGVFWDAQDVFMEDIDRIEVIRGPGATLWGANAVNGVINIITKHAEKTQGGLLTGGGGSQEAGFGGLRYGKQLAKDTYGRVYVKGFQRNAFKSYEGITKADDSWNKQQGGFRIDSRLTDQDDLTLQGDIYRSVESQAIITPLRGIPYTENNINDTIDSTGWNIRSRIKHTLSTTAEYTLQFYYDHTNRDEYFYKQALDTLDVDFQNNFALNNSNNAVWGLNYRVNMDKFMNTPMSTLTPISRNTQIFSAFVQDEITLINNTLWFTLGSKFEHNDYTGFEGQPTARLMWAPSPRQRIWTSVSRAVRTPSRGESDIHIFQTTIKSPPIAALGGTTLPVEISINGNKNYYSEIEFAYELGYRFTLSKQASLDITAFYNDYHKLRDAVKGQYTLSTSPTSIQIDQPFNLNNAGKGSTYGIELASVWQMTHWWRWDANYSFIKTYINDFGANPGLISPLHKASLRAVINPTETLSLDFWLRYNGTYTPPAEKSLLGSSTSSVADYLTLDIRLAWQALPTLELSLVGQNLLDNRHLEYVDKSLITPMEVPRGVYGKVAVAF